MADPGTQPADTEPIVPEDVAAETCAKGDGSSGLNSPSSDDVVEVVYEDDPPNGAAASQSVPPFLVQSQVQLPAAMHPTRPMEHEVIDICDEPDELPLQVHDEMECTLQRRSAVSEPMDPSPLQGNSIEPPLPPPNTPDQVAPSMPHSEPPTNKDTLPCISQPHTSVKPSELSPCSSTPFIIPKQVTSSRCISPPLPPSNISGVRVAAVNAQVDRSNSNFPQPPPAVRPTHETLTPLPPEPSSSSPSSAANPKTTVTYANEPAFLRAAPTGSSPVGNAIMPPPPSNNITIYVQCPEEPEPIAVVLLKSWVTHDEAVLIIQRIRMVLTKHCRNPLPEPFGLEESDTAVVPAPSSASSSSSASASGSVVPFGSVQHRKTYRLVPSAGYPRRGFGALDYHTLPAPTTKGERSLVEAECLQLWVLLKSLNQPDKVAIKAAMKALREFLSLRLSRRSQHIAIILRRFVARYDDPAALVHTTMVLSDVIFRHLQSDDTPPQGLLDAIPHIFSAIHRKVGAQWRRIVWQVVDVWDSKPDDFPERLRLETRTEMLLNGSSEESPDAARVYFELPDAFLEDFGLAGPTLKQWAEEFCQQFGYLEGHTLDQTVSPPTMTVRYDRHASGLLLHRFLYRYMYATPRYDFKSTIEAVPGPILKPKDVPDLGPVGLFQPIAMVSNGALQWALDFPHQSRGSPAEFARRTPVTFNQLAYLCWVTVLNGAQELKSGNLVPLGPNLATVAGSLFQHFPDTPQLLPERQRLWEPVAWTAIRLRFSKEIATSRAIPRNALRLSSSLHPSYKRTGEPAANRDWADMVLIWFEEDIFGDDYFHLHAEAPRPLDTLTFFALQTAPSPAYVLQNTYPLHASRFKVPIPTFDVGKDKSYTCDLLPREQRNIAMAQLEQLRDELISTISKVAGSWAQPELIACPTRWIYLPDDVHTFAARVTCAEGALGGILIPHNPQKASQVAGFFLDVPAPAQGTSRFLDPHSPHFVPQATCWIWASLCRRPHVPALLPFIRYVARHTVDILSYLRRIDVTHRTPLSQELRLELSQLCLLLQDGTDENRLVNAIVSGDGLEDISSESTSSSCQEAKRSGKKKKRKRSRSRKEKKHKADKDGHQRKKKKEKKAKRHAEEWDDGHSNGAGRSRESKEQRDEAHTKHHKHHKKRHRSRSGSRCHKRKK